MLEPELTASKFIRIHKSFILSVESITSVGKNSVFINDMEFPIVETFWDAVEKLIRKKVL